MAPGANTIVRHAADSSVTVPDVPSFHALIEAADAAVAAGEELHQEQYERACGIPNRLLLPKGTSEGMEFVLAVAVTDGETDEQHDILEKQDVHGHAQCGVHGEKYPDHLPMGFPLDRHIEDERILLSSPNVKYTIVKITHTGTH